MQISESNFALKSFQQGKEVIPIPFELKINKATYHCTQILRLLPGKRLVVRAQDTNGQQLVIKIFVKKKKGERELVREKRGYQLAKQVGVNVPELIFASKNEPKYCAIAYQYLENAKPFSNTIETLTEHGNELLYITAVLHNFGVVHNDFHLENILIEEENLYLIDLASISNKQNNKSLDKHTSLANLAVLVVQFRPKEQQILINQLQRYYQERNWQFEEEEKIKFDIYVDKAWQKRKINHLHKCFRNCTMTVYKKTFSQQYGFCRSFFEKIDENFIKDIDKLVSNGQILKAGNSATVTQVNYAGKKLVIKRYNIKSIWHFLNRCYRPSRAAISWRNGILLQLLGIATPNPLGFIENRCGWFRKTAYLVCEQSDGQEMSSVFKERMPTENELAQLKDIFGTLKKYRISHGDLKATNFLIKKKGEVQLIDLDAMYEHNNNERFQRSLAEDKYRFVANWQNPDIKAAVESLFE